MEDGEVKYNKIILYYTHNILSIQNHLFIIVLRVNMYTSDVRISIKHTIMDDQTPGLFNVSLRAMMTAIAFGKQKKKTRLINQSNVSDILNDVMAACIVIRSWRRAIHHLLTSDWSHYLSGALPLGPPHSLPLKTASPKLGNIPKVRKHSSAEVFLTGTEM